MATIPGARVGVVSGKVRATTSGAWQTFGFEQVRSSRIAQASSTGLDPRIQIYSVDEIIVGARNRCPLLSVNSGHASHVEIRYLTDRHIVPARLVQLRDVNAAIRLLLIESDRRVAYGAIPLQTPGKANPNAHLAASKLHQGVRRSRERTARQIQRSNEPDEGDIYEPL